MCSVVYFEYRRALLVLRINYYKLYVYICSSTVLKQYDSDMTDPSAVR